DCEQAVEVARRPTVEPGRAASLHPDALTVVDARGHAYLHRAGSDLDAASLAVLALVLDDAAASTACGTHLRERERSLVDGDRSGAATRGAHVGKCARLRTAP